MFLCKATGYCIRLSFPHASGGVSYTWHSAPIVKEFSPREWGCFYPGDPAGGAKNVFPTRVGVFLVVAPMAQACSGFPHASGGVSIPSLCSECASQFSPREWGCFPADGP